MTNQHYCIQFNRTLHLCRCPACEHWEACCLEFNKKGYQLLPHGKNGLAWKYTGGRQ